MLFRSDLEVEDPELKSFDVDERFEERHQVLPMPGSTFLPRELPDDDAIVPNALLRSFAAGAAVVAIRELACAAAERRRGGSLQTRAPAPAPDVRRRTRHLGTLGAWDLVLVSLTAKMKLTCLPVRGTWLPCSGNPAWLTFLKAERSPSCSSSSIQGRPLSTRSSLWRCASSSHPLPSSLLTLLSPQEWTAIQDRKSVV